MTNTNTAALVAPPRGKTLSGASEYEQTFNTRHRGPGRPVDAEPVFPDNYGDTHPVIMDVAIRRAYSVVHERHKDELTDVFLRELKVLRRRGAEQVAMDSNRWNAYLRSLGLDPADFVGAGAVV